MQDFLAKTLTGLEPVLARELEDLGATDVQPSSRAVLFNATQEVLYKANYLCRTALRILKCIKSFEIRRQEDLYDQIYDVAWEKVFSVDELMTFNATCIDSVFTHSRFVSQRIKDAIVDRFRRVFGRRPSVDNEFYTVRVELFMKDNKCDLLLDASGLSLHNRGYRKPNSETFNEVMAAGLLKLMDWKGDKNLFIPFCRNGVLAIEAAMLASNMPAGYYRKGYSFQYWNDYDPYLWKTVKENADKAICDPEAELIASTPNGLELEKLEGLLKKLRLHHDVDTMLFDFYSGEKPGGMDPEGLKIILLLPDIGDPESFEAESICTQVGDILKKDYKGAQAWVYTTDVDAIKFVGMKPDYKFALSEVSKPSRFHGFDIR